MQDALVLTVLGMGTVIVVLYIISLMIRLNGRLVASRSAKAAPAPAATPPTPADKPGPPSKEGSIFFPGCLVWLVFMPIVLLICIYHGIDMFR